MSCHFSPYGTGLSSIPPSLPEGSVLMLTDRTPIAGHDPALVAQQLAAAAEKLKAAAVVLDLQRESPEAAAVVEAVLALPCPVVVSQRYAGERDCAVLVAAPELWTPLDEALAPWKGRPIWLEAVTDSALVTVTDQGSRYKCCVEQPSDPQTDAAMHILYETKLLPTHAEYRLWRDTVQLAGFMKEAKALGAAEFLGLYQQLTGRAPETPIQTPQ